jgi:dynein heavy chain
MSFKTPEVIEHLQKLPEFDMPEIFGMNMNAEIIYQFKESSKVVQCVLDLQPRDSSTGEGEKEPDEQVMDLMVFLTEKVPVVNFYFFLGSNWYSRYWKKVRRKHW